MTCAVGPLRRARHPVVTGHCEPTACAAGSSCAHSLTALATSASSFSRSVGWVGGCTILPPHPGHGWCAVGKHPALCCARQSPPGSLPTTTLLPCSHRPVASLPLLCCPVVTARLNVASLPPRSAALQDDMQLSPDFFTYFEAAAPILDADDSLMCVSSWNDHGQASSAAAGWGTCCVVRCRA